MPEDCTHYMHYLQEHGITKPKSRKMPPSNSSSSHDKKLEAAALHDKGAEKHKGEDHK